MRLMKLAAALGALAFSVALSPATIAADNTDPDPGRCCLTHHQICSQQESSWVARGHTIIGPTCDSRLPSCLKTGMWDRGIVGAPVATNRTCNKA